MVKTLHGVASSDSAHRYNNNIVTLAIKMKLGERWG